MDDLAPIVLFVYDRPWHTKQTVEALQKNELATESELFIYSDAAKNHDVHKYVEEIRQYLKTIDGFKKITIIERDENWGLANSIIEGVTKIVNVYGKIIVLEDDLVTSPYFLKFMNEALKFYEKNINIWHISGWNYPMQSKNEDIFIWRGMECWGWGTWKDRWKYFKKDSSKLIQEFDKEDIYKLNLDGKRDVWRQVVLNDKNKINTWAVFWYATIYKNKALSVNPIHTFVKNIGLDGTGQNCTGNDIYMDLLNEKDNYTFYTSDEENKYYVDKIKKFSDDNKIPIYRKIINKIKKFLG